ncbi:MAG: antibiotic biosynthesis monooxygenase [Planctomycetota bacterium]
MIVRTWSGATAHENGDAYERFMVERAAPDYRSIPGCIGLWFTRRDEPERSHFLLVTIWESLEAVEDFAGPDAERAKYYPEDDRYLLSKDPIARNWAVFHHEPTG